MTRAAVKLAINHLTVALFHFILKSELIYLAKETLVQPTEVSLSA